MILVTGAAGFIGAHVAARLAASGHAVLGLDNFDDGYDAQLKEARVAALLTPAMVKVLRIDCADGPALQDVFARHAITYVVHMAGRANVRDSMVRPDLFTRANVTAFGHLLGCCTRARVSHLVYASSSSVYGAVAGPAAEGQVLPAPPSLYAATKLANEAAALDCSRHHSLPATGLRLFTVYGPWGRPDMAAVIFARAIARGEPVMLFNHGELRRDFVFIDDAVDAVCAALFKPPAVTACAPHLLLNVGHPPAVPVIELVRLLEHCMGRAATVQLQDLPQGDVACTWSDTQRLRVWLGSQPSTPLADGVARLAAWCRSYYPD